MTAKVCELCNNEASLYCGADGAFLCRSCDAKVHVANFLVARHVRQVLCPKCKMVTEDSICGATFECDSSQPPLHNCQSCSLPLENHTQREGQQHSATSSSDCISTTESSAKNATPFGYHKRKAIDIASSSSVKRVWLRSSREGAAKKRKKGRELAPPAATSINVDAKVEGIFANWCNGLDLKGDGAVVVSSSASGALGLCLSTRFASLPFRVSLAASFWLGLRSCGASRRSLLTWQNLRRLEQVSGVPGKLILAVERKLARAYKVSREQPPLDLEEGWAES